jgi:hypothetical protein
VGRSGSGGSASGSGTLVSYNLEHDQIDDEAVDDFIDRKAVPEDGEEEDGSEPKSPLESPIEAMETETVSSDDDFSSPSSLKGTKLPAEPGGKCNAKLQEKFAKMYESKQAGRLNMNEIIQTKKMFRNPSIYEKLISHLNIDEFGTNYPEVKISKLFRSYLLLDLENLLSFTSGLCIYPFRKSTIRTSGQNPHTMTS